MLCFENLSKCTIDIYYYTAELVDGEKEHSDWFPERSVFWCAMLVRSKWRDIGLVLFRVFMDLAIFRHLDFTVGPQ